jgi:putative membrane protein
MTLVGFPFVILPLLFKFRTLRYRFDDKGVSMSWGLLFKRETYLTYRRIQDIHVTRNLFHRWLGLATVSVQTASGTAGAEMSIEGIRHPEALRDYLYAQMRGAQDQSEGDGASDTSPDAAGDEALELLRSVVHEVQRLRAVLEQRT